MRRIKTFLAKQKILVCVCCVLLSVLLLGICVRIFSKQIEYKQKQYLVDYMFLSNTTRLFAEVEKDWLKLPEFVVNKKQLIANCLDENMKYNDGNLVLALHLQNLYYWEFKRFTDKSQEQIHRMLDAALINEIPIEEISFSISIKTSSVLKRDEVCLLLDIPGKETESVFIIK